MLKKIAVGGLALLISGSISAVALAATAPVLGAAASYAILDTNTPNASQARLDAQAAYAALVGTPCTRDLTGQDVNNQVYGAGVYCFAGSSFLNGQITFDAQNDPNAVFIVKVNGAYTIGSFSLVNLIHGARPQNVFWQVNGPLSIGANDRLAGTFIARGNVNVGSDTTIDGRVWSTEGTVTTSSGTRIGFVPAPIPPVPAPVPAPTPTPGTPSPTTGTIIVVNNTSDFALFVDGFRVMSGQPYIFAPGTHTVTEVNLTSTEYAPPTYSGDCVANGLVGMITLAAGDTKTCTVTNVTGVGGIGDLPGLPNTGGGGSYFPIVVAIGAALAAAGLALSERSRRVAR